MNKIHVVCSVPACEFGGDLAEQVGRGSGAAVRWQRGIVAECR